MTSCKDLLKAKKIDMTFYSIMESISHLGKMVRTSAKSENPNCCENFKFIQTNMTRRTLLKTG